MIFLRIVAVAVPQILALLVAGAYFDLLGGWNHGSNAFGTLLGLMLLARLETLTLLFVEMVRCSKSFKLSKWQKPLALSLLAAILLIEALAIDLLILSQARM